MSTQHEATVDSTYVSDDGARHVAWHVRCRWCGVSSGHKTEQGARAWKAGHDTAVRCAAKAAIVEAMNER